MTPFNVHSVHYDVQSNVHSPRDLGLKSILYRLENNIYYIIYTLSMYMYCTCTFSLYSSILKVQFLEAV